MTKHLHERRGVSFAELGALLGARNLLAANLVKHVDSQHVAYVGAGHGQHMFHMSIGCAGEGCGTAACIGGLMALIMGKTVSDSKNYVSFGGHPISLDALFYPSIDCDVQRYSRITNEEAVVAIDRWFDNQKPYWKHSLQREIDDGKHD